MSKVKENPENIQVYIQSQLGVFRKRKNITQEQLAFMVSISPKALSDIENNRRGVSMITLIKLCQVLDIDIKNIFNEKKK